MTRGWSLTVEEAFDHFDAARAEPLSMDEQAFRVFYNWTGRPLRSYIAHLTGDAALAEDLMQEAYLRLLRASLPPMDDAQRKSYLFRIATNLVHDHFRASRHEGGPLPEISSDARIGEKVALRADLSEAFRELKPRHREMLWMAYAEGATHQEIAEATGMKVQSVRPLLFRARQRLAEILRRRGFAPEAP
jgi:RNA polymerase sigma-70 factor (ECF subfamily)